MDFWELLESLARLPDQRLAAPWRWPGHQGEQLGGRECLYRVLEAEQSALTAAAARTEAGRILAQAQEAFRDLCGLLLGLDAAAFNRSPGPGEWSLRQVLAHVLLVERRYQFQVAYAARRKDSDPVRRQPVGVKVSPAEVRDRARSLGALAAARRRSNRLARLPDAALSRPTSWAGYDVDVRFRLHRFAAHLAEHTVQGEKALAALGWRPSEAQRVVRAIARRRGAHEMLTAAPGLRALDRAQARLAASLGQPTSR